MGSGSVDQIGPFLDGSRGSWVEFTLTRDPLLFHQPSKSQ